MKRKVYAFIVGTLLIPMLILQSISPFSYCIPTDENAENVLTSISENEKKVIQELFVLSSDIELLNTEAEKLKGEIIQIKKDISESEGEIEAAQLAYNDLQENLKAVLKIEQRSGIASSVEIILNAKNLKDLISRINLLRDLSKNVDQLMQETEKAYDQLVVKKDQLNTLLDKKTTSEKELLDTIQEKTQAKEKLEAYLNSLATEKAHYESYLKSIETQWNSLKPLFRTTIDTFTKIIETGDVPADTAELTISLTGSKGIIREKKFNAVMSKREDLPELTFDFKKSGVHLLFPSYEVVLSGKFELLDPQTIQFTVSGGTFYGLPMSESAIKDLFSEGQIVFKLKSLIGKNKIKTITMFDDRIELSVSISLF